MQRIRRAIRNQNYRISAHANEEMAKDWLEAIDVESVILTGRITQTFTGDPRGLRYEVLGKTTTDQPACVVSRFFLSGTLLIITAWTVK